MRVQFLRISACALFFFSCGVSARIWNKGDVSPPQLQSLMMLDKNTIEFIFDEEIKLREEDIFFKSNSEIEELRVEKERFEIDIIPQTIAGEEYEFKATVKDSVGNTMLIIDAFYGYNGAIPDMVISEFTCEGSKRNGDKVELAVLSEGNTAGMVLQEGGMLHFAQQIRLPPLKVRKGEYIVVHFRPDPLENIENEEKSMADSVHPQAHDQAWDVFSGKDKGISNTNATLSLLSYPRGPLVDSVIYSTKSDDAEHAYRGFSSSKAFNWASEVAAHGAWKAKGEELFPSDAVNPKDSTSTRSISRNAVLEDSDSKADWHITPTRGSTFGEKNSDAVYKNKQ